MRLLTTTLDAPRSYARWLFALVLLACSGQQTSSGPDGSSGGSQQGSAGSTAGTGGGAPAAGTTAAGGSSPGGTAGTGGGRAAGGAAPAGGAAGAGGAAAGAAGAFAGAPAGGSAGSGEGATGGATAGSATGGGGGAAGGGSGAGGSGGAPGDACDAAATVAAMKLGWNLGNSLDAFDTSRSDTTVETAWGNPTITRELLRAVAAAGFGAVRIPVTWIGRFGAAPDYPISATFMNRVEEVVNYALDEGLYVIINVHHDGAEGVNGAWIGLVDGSGNVNAEHTAAVLVQFRKIWTQIAARFKDYDFELLLEGMNEIKVGYDTPLPSYLEQVNDLNQAFVETIRASGGKNAGRCLVVPGYNTNIDHTVAGFVKPADDAPGKLILSDHYYDPWSFAGEASKQVWGAGYPGADTWGQEDHVRAQVQKLVTTFIDQGLPMIWGEYGAVQQNGYEEYRRYYMEYVTKAVHDAGIAPFVWDNGALASGAEGFGLFDRRDNSVRYPEVLEAILRAVNSDYSLEDVAKP